MLILDLATGTAAAPPPLRTLLRMPGRLGELNERAKEPYKEIVEAESRRPTVNLRWAWLNEGGDHVLARLTEG